MLLYFLTKLEKNKNATLINAYSGIKIFPATVRLMDRIYNNDGHKYDGSDSFDCHVDVNTQPQGVAIFSNYTITYDYGKTSTRVNGLMLRAAFPRLQCGPEDALVLPEATQTTINIILSIAYLGRSYIHDHLWNKKVL